MTDEATLQAPAALRREARIDTGAIARNVRTLRAATGARLVMAVVKADGYGHGAVASARAALAGGADRLGVVDIREALALRAAGIDAPVLTWMHAPGADFGTAIAHGIDLGLNSLRQVWEAGEAARRVGRPADVHLKVDTGLGRNGVTASEWPSVVAEVRALVADGSVRLGGVFSHLANAGVDEDSAQVRAFHAALDVVRAAGLEPGIRHLAATAGALRVPDARLDMVRLGIGIYGISPLEGVTSAELGLVPAMTLVGSVVAVKRVPADTGVSYGYTYRTTRATTLALVSLGFADGVPRLASNRAPVAIHGARFRVSGRIAMDQFVVDVGDGVVDGRAVAVGDDAVLFGDPATGAPSVEEWAEATGTIGYEIVTRVAGRVTRRHLA
ncbi:alanine racemase [Clavibacter michiganensis]|uniref:Alanine racemase n=1 Tax=Clavibacter michiganensis TaxID=28447 RepID=A0A2S5VV59_9MICO|nr:alanine racemase [Clavibacter michiganensis]PPF68851.1 alanine racemase [Clavibacter michiganensis]